MRKILLNSWKVLRAPERKRFRVLLLLDIVVSTIDIISLAAIVWTVHVYTSPAPTAIPAYVPHWLNGLGSGNMVLAMVVLFTVKTAAAFLVVRANLRFNGDVAIRISSENLERFQQSPYHDYVTTDSSRSIRNICFQPFEFCQHVLTGIQQVVTQAWLITLAIAGILWFNPWLVLVLLLIMLPPVTVLFLFLRKRSAVLRRDIQIHNERSYQHLLDALKGYIESNIYARNAFFRERFVNDRKKFSKALFGSMAIQHLPPRILELVAVGGVFIVIGVSRGMDAPGSGITVTLGAFLAAAYKIIPGITKLMTGLSQINSFKATTDELTHLPVGAHEESPAMIQEEICSLRLDRVSFDFAGVPVIHDVSGDILKGDMVGIAGPSGRGKTTLLNIILGFLEPTGGSVIINGKSCNAGNIQSYWPQIAYVRQQGFLIHDSILRNVTLADMTESMMRLETAISGSGLDSIYAGSPAGVDETVMENGKNLSGGQQQRISLARAFYKNAEIIILDEPFNELDNDAELAIMRHLQLMAASGKIIILVTHQKSTLAFCNKIISLHAVSH